MSSDLFEREGLVGSYFKRIKLKEGRLMETVEQDLEVSTRAQVNGAVKVNGEKASVRRGENELKVNRCLNAATIVTRIPLEAISLQRKNGIFEKMLKLDQAIASGDTILRFKQVEEQEFLFVIRHAMIRFANSVAKSVIEVVPPGFF